MATGSHGNQRQLQILSKFGFHAFDVAAFQGFE